jgi:ferric-dicitrate binding protein FerR (iron transport regulator)
VEPDRLPDLLDAYHDGRLTEADHAALCALLASSPDACRRFWEAAQQHALLVDLLAEARGLALAQAEQGLKLYDPDGKQAASRSARLLRLWLALTAAVLLLSAGLSWLVAPPEGGSLQVRDAVGPQLAELHGDVQVIQEEARQLAQAGQVLRAGQEVHTGEGSSVRLTYADSSSLDLTANTAVQMLPREDAAGKLLFLVKGAVHARVAPQPRGRPLVLRTEQADLLVPGTRFRSASVLGEMRVELEEGKALLSRKGDRPIEIGTGSYAVAAGDGEMISAAPMVPSSGAPYATLEEGSGPVMALTAVGPHALAVGCWNGIVKLWDLSTRQVRGRLDAGASRTLALASAADGRTLAVGYETRKKGESGVAVWDLIERRVVRDLPAVRRAHALALLPDGRTLALTAGKGALVWDAGDTRERLVLGERSDRVRCLALSPDGRTLAAGCTDGRVRLWDLLSGRLEGTLQGAPREVQALAFHPGGALLAGGGRDGVVRLWSLPGGEEVRRFAGNFKEVRCLAFSPDGRTLATGHGGAAVLWDATTGRRRSTLKAHQFAITALVYLPDGRTLASAGWDRTVKLWDLHPADEGRE